MQSGAGKNRARKLHSSSFSMHSGVMHGHRAAVKYFIKVCASLHHSHTAAPHSAEVENLAET